MNRIDEIKARCEAATPGPWETEGAKLNRAVIGGKVELLNWVGDSLFYSKDDFAFIAAAREDIPFLLAMVDTLQAGQKMMESDQASAEMNLERLTAERDAAMRRAEAERARKQTKLTPIYTCGGHSLSKDWDDDDEDFWCPICHTHIGTHCGYAAECPKCGQAINTDSEPCYNYRDMKNSKREWRGPEPGGEGKP